MFTCCKTTILPSSQQNTSNNNNEQTELEDGKTKNLDTSPSSFPNLDVQMHRSKSEQRILQKTAPPLGEKGGVGNSSARSLLEASGYRVATHEYNTKIKSNQPDSDHGGIPEKFLKAYEQALRQSNINWTSNPAVSSLFADNAKLFTQDKQLFTGKPAVLTRLDQGIEMLIKMSGNDAVDADWEIKGPTFSVEKGHEYRCTVKIGLMKISFALEFKIANGKIMELKNTRL